MTSGERLIVALDEASLRSALAMAKQFRGLIRTVKVGSALFTAAGPAAIQRLRALGFDVMLDLKYFDIPSTVERSCRAAVRHRVAMLTIHASAQPAALEAAVGGVRDEARRLRVARPLVLGVTVLTSDGSGIRAATRRRVLALAQAAIRAGCDGVVASAQEARLLRQRVGRRVRIVCPGIRLAADARGDQRRVASPRQALADGADVLVVGRPITAARDPRAVVRQILSEMEEAC